MRRELRYSEAIELACKMDALLRELADFTDGEEDRIAVDGAEDDPEYINALADACTRMDEACVAMSVIE